VHAEQCFGSSQTIIEVISDMAPDEVMETCSADNREEHSSICRNVLSGSMAPCPGNVHYLTSPFYILFHPRHRKFIEILEAQTGAEIPTSEKMSELAEDSRLQCMEFASPVLANFASKECGETPEPQVLNEIVEDSRLQCIEFNSPAHTILPDKTGAENFASPSFDVVAKDSKPPSLEFTSPAHTVATFQPYADGIPTPKFTASVSFQFFS
jgi:transcription factor MYB, plant